MIFEANQVINKMNKFTAQSKPYFILTDFKAERAYFIEDFSNENINFDFSGNQNINNHNKIKLEKFPEDFEIYEKKFRFVLNEINIGNSFLVNLTSKTKINVNKNLETIFESAFAKYKVLVKGKFCFFSPETFIKVSNEGIISSFPMKGTIDASSIDAEKQILENLKEFHEHTTIVDLIRNDLSQIAEKVWVEKFRYIDKIKKNDTSEILQVSSEIKGQLPLNWKSNFGELFWKLLPAGSISGAPKTKTIEIIESIESEERGFYTGIAGYFDGRSFNSCVAIRFIEKQKNQLYFRSGGGLTTKSDLYEEFLEILQKIYVPIF